MAGTIPLLYQNPATGVSAPAAYVAELACTTNTTVSPTQNGYLFTNANAAGLVNFTLPKMTNAGYLLGFMVLANQTVTVTSAEGNNIVWFNTVVANSLSFNTSNGKIGGCLVFMTNANGSLWFVDNCSAGPNGSGGNVVTQA